MDPLTVDAAAITNFNDAANEGGPALTETLTNFIGPIALVAIVTFLLWITIIGFKSPMRLVKRH